MKSKQEYKITFGTKDFNNFSFLDVEIIRKKTSGLLLRFFAKPHLVEFELITIVLFLIPSREV